MSIVEQPIKALGWNNDALQFIDQTALPNNLFTVTTSNYREIIDAIKILKIRGAPSIGIAVGYAAVLAVAIEGKNLDESDFSRWVNSALNEIESARPTARNLFFVTERMRPVDLPLMFGLFFKLVNSSIYSLLYYSLVLRPNLVV